MAEEVYNNPEAFQQVHNPLQAMSPGERVICEIRRHPVGMMAKYAMAAFLFVALAVFAVYVVPTVSASSTSQFSESQVREFAMVGVLAIAAIGGLLLWVTASIYYKNRWIVTSDSITQVSQTGLFSTQMSQLSMANLQDVTVVQDGVFPTMMNYGILRAETAGERSKFIFFYCPNPKYYAQQILITRENFINTSPETAKRANDDLAVPRSSSSDGLSINRPADEGQYDDSDDNSDNFDSHIA